MKKTCPLCKGSGNLWQEKRQNNVGWVGCYSCPKCWGLGIILEKTKIPGNNFKNSIK